jgi:hypothetical protein
MGSLCACVMVSHYITKSMGMGSWKDLDLATYLARGSSSKSRYGTYCTLL